MKSNLNKSTATKLFRLVKNLLPISNTLPTTHTQILNVLGRISLFQSKFYCNGCNQLYITRKNKKICDNQNCSFSNMPFKICDIREVVDLDISSQIETIINRNSSLLFDQNQLSQQFDVPYGEQYGSVTMGNNKRITPIIHAGGAPLVRTTKSPLWPVFASHERGILDSGVLTHLGAIYTHVSFQWSVCLPITLIVTISLFLMIAGCF